MKTKTEYPKLLSEIKNSRGFMLFMSYLFMMSISVVSLGIFNRGHGFLQTAERNQKKLAAFQIAEAGFDDAYWRIKNNQIPGYPWVSGYVALDTGNMRGGYGVTVTDMGNNIKRISTVGYSPAQTVANESQEVRAVTGYVQQLPSSAFNFGIFAKDSITMNGNAVTDSYDSRDGGYGGNNVSQRGHIATDTTVPGSVRLTGNVQVQGNATVGPDGDPASVITLTGNSVITGIRTAAPEPQNPPVISTALSSEGALNLSGNTTYSLSAGDHRFSSLRISGNATLRPLGPVRIYVDGSVSISGNGIATTNNSPPNTLIFVTGDSEVSISGNGSLYAGIYAPRSQVRNVGNGEIFGAVVAREYDQHGNGNIHFDEALRQVGGAGGGLSLLSWQENNITAQSTSDGTPY